ncbi:MULTISPECIES: MerR family transcriptional regulator [unclassified Streptomyces]|uniref:MerR family transcriptional regulator n=1 Tax=unclassified Streptomyces TaxID=2593676 RepID=UPI0009A0DCF7|nr:MerR family transcriptional regulator [Streptomyces sp. CB02058]
MRIGDLASETGVSRRLLRYYEEQGLLRPTRSANGYRDYAETDVARVNHVRALLAAGLSTTVIAQVVHCVHSKGELEMPAGCPTFVGVIRRERARVTESIALLESSRTILDTILGTASRDGQEPVRDTSSASADRRLPARTGAAPRGSGRTAD